MKTVIYTTYAPDTDITFIMEDIFEGDECISTEVKGFYYGIQNIKDIGKFYGDLRATFNKPKKDFIHKGVIGNVGKRKILFCRRWWNLCN